MPAKTRVLQYHRPPPASKVEVLPWDSVKSHTTKSGRIIKHVIEKLGVQHLEVYVDSLGYIRRPDLGRRQVVDCDVEKCLITAAYIV